MIQLEELKSTLADLIKQKKDIQQRINSIRNQISNKQVYDKYYRGTVNHNLIRDGVTAQELFGKPHHCLTAEEMKLYRRIKQKERRARVKAERSGQ